MLGGWPGRGWRRREIKELWTENKWKTHGPHGSPSLSLASHSPGPTPGPQTHCAHPGRGLHTWTGSTVSLTTHRTSKREMMGSVRSTFSEKVSEGS